MRPYRKGKHDAGQRSAAGQGELDPQIAGEFFPGRSHRRHNAAEESLVDDQEYGDARRDGSDLGDAD